MDKDQMQLILEKHALWLSGDPAGERADLRYANLRYANLRGADLRDANLRGADLRGADLSDANLSDANLRDANLRDANLSDANLRDANLRGADLRGADLSDANLRYANLSYANLSDAVARLDFGGWSICVRCDATSIGCETHPNEDWLAWSPDDVAKFDPKAKGWWEIHGVAVKAVIRCVISKHKKLTEKENL